MEEIWLVVLQYPFIHTCLKFLFSLRKEDHKDLLNIEWKIWAFAIKDKKEEALTPEIQTKNNNYSLQKKTKTHLRCCMPCHPSVKIKLYSIIIYAMNLLQL